MMGEKMYQGLLCINYHVLITHRDSFVMWKKHKGQKLFDPFHLFVCVWFFFGGEGSLLLVFFLFSCTTQLEGS